MKLTVERHHKIHLAISQPTSRFVVVMVGPVYIMACAKAVDMLLTGEYQRALFG